LVDMRFHVFSLVSIFLALAVGMLIGSMYLDQDALSVGQDYLVKALEDRFARLQQDRALLENRIETLEADHHRQQEMLDAMVAYAVEGRLVDLRIELVVLPETFDLADPSSVKNDVTSLLQSAGAWVDSRVTPQGRPSTGESAPSHITVLLCGDSRSHIPCIETGASERCLLAITRARPPADLPSALPVVTEVGSPSGGVRLVIALRELAGVP